MIVSNEPGYYKKGEFGIRIENLIFIKKLKKKLFFENLTLAPIDKDLIDYKMLTNDEKDYIFKYHLMVYSKLSSFLSLGKDRHGLVDLFPCHISFVTVLNFAHCFTNHGSIHDSN